MNKISKLKGKIVENGLNVTKLAEIVGIDKATMYRKLNDGGESFLISEVKKIIKALNISNSEAVDIFFT